MRGCRLHYLERGSGPPVLLVHGLGAAAHVWDAVELPGRAVAVDLPGCGGSQPRHEPQGPAMLAGLLADFADEVLGDERFAVVGHSLGSLVAAELALLRPGRVRAAVFIDLPLRVPALARLPALPLVGELVFGLWSLGPVSRAAIRLYLGFLFGDRRKVTEATVEAYLRAASCPGYFPSVLAGLRGLAGWDGEERLRSLPVPVAVIWGTKDPIFPLALGRRLAQSLPGASFHPLEGCGHSPPEEAPDEVSAIVGAFLESASRPACA